MQLGPDSVAARRVKACSIGGLGCSERGYAGPATRQWSEKPSSPDRVRRYPHGISFVRVKPPDI